MEPTDHPLEAALRAQAERRRAELTRTPEMPGPMRTALHRELEKQQAPTRPRASWLDRLFQWQAFLATAATAVVAVGFVGYTQHWWGGPRRMVTEAQTAPAPAAAGGNAAGEKKEDALVAKTKKADAVPAPADAKAAKPAEVAAARAEPAKPAEESAKREVAAAAPMTGGVPTTNGVASTTEESGAGAASPGYRESQPLPPPTVATVPEQPRVTDALKLSEPMTERRRLDDERNLAAAPAPTAPTAPMVAYDSTTRPPGSGGPAPPAALDAAAPASKPASMPPRPKAAVAPPIASAPPPPAKRTFIGGAATGSTANTPSSFANNQRFVQTPAQLATRGQRAAKQETQKNAAESVLNDFTLSQSGNAILLTDRDGSEYRGQIIPAASQSRAGRSQSSRAAKDVDQLSEGYTFRASGVSKSLGQRVTIEADVEPVAGSLAGGRDKVQSGPVEGLRQLPADPSNQNQIQLQIPQQNRKAQDQRLRLVGEVRVNKDVVEVEAVSEN